MPVAGYEFKFLDESLIATGTGALFWPRQKLLAVADLHLGKSERLARSRAVLLPPYESEDTLLALEKDIAASEAELVVCLGDSFDDNLSASSLSEESECTLAKLSGDREWIWVAGNHDPASGRRDGGCASELAVHPFVFRHIAAESVCGEISGHYHPKASIFLRGRSITRSCFLADQNRVILPAYGVYTGGLRCHTPPLRDVMDEDAIAIMTGRHPLAFPMPR